MKPGEKYLKEETEVKNKNNIENRNTKDNNTFKFQSHSYIKYIYHLIFCFIFALVSEIFFSYECDISNKIYMFCYLYFLVDNTNKKRNNNYKNNNINSNINIKFIVSKLLLNGIKYIKRLKIILCLIINKLVNKKAYVRFSFFYFSLFIFIINIKSLEAYQEINITIKGTGTQQIVNDHYLDGDEMDYYKPNKILINGIPQDYTDFYVYDLVNDLNIITLRWDNKLTVCAIMFYELDNIIDINFSNFDTSEVEDMDYMFFNLNSIKTLDLSNFNTSSVNSMELMFYGCTSLLSLNLNNFDTSQVTSFNNMFKDCISLIYLNLNSFIFQQDSEIDEMLDGTSDNLLLCYNNEKSASELGSYTNNCDNACFNKEPKLIIEGKTCTNECKNDNIYKYDYKKLCFKTCEEIPESFYGSSDYKIEYNNDKTKCIDVMPEYLINIINNKIK